MTNFLQRVVTCVIIPNAILEDGSGGWKGWWQALCFPMFLTGLPGKDSTNPQSKESKCWDDVFCPTKATYLLSDVLLEGQPASCVPDNTRVTGAWKVVSSHRIPYMLLWHLDKMILLCETWPRGCMHRINRCCGLFCIRRLEPKRSKVLASMFFYLPDHHHLIKLHFFGLKLWGKWDNFIELLTRFCPKKRIWNCLKKTNKKSDRGFHSDWGAFSALRFHLLSVTSGCCVAGSHIYLCLPSRLCSMDSVHRAWMTECHSLK